MEGMILTGPYLSICDLHRSHRREGLITGLVVIQVIWVSDRPLWLKCLLQNPLLWLKYQILIGSFWVLLNYAFHTRGGGEGVRKKMECLVLLYIQIIISIVWNFCACSSNLILRKTVEGSRNVGWFFSLLQVRLFLFLNNEKLALNTGRNCLPFKQRLYKAV